MCIPNMVSQWKQFTGNLCLFRACGVGAWWPHAVQLAFATDHGSALRDSVIVRMAQIFLSLHPRRCPMGLRTVWVGLGAGAPDAAGEQRQDKQRMNTVPDSRTLCDVQLNGGRKTSCQYLKELQGSSMNP